MSNREPTPYGLKSLLECMSRAVLLKQPDDIPGFLSKFMEEMIQFRGGDEARDIKEVAFDYGEQWGKF
uniref:RIIa domain-containing protein n=1 Tax=Sparus aurata TaxID=8175 RepID=A0A671XA57_SPAAU